MTKPNDDQIIIGGESQVIEAAKQILINDGAKVLETYILAQVSPAAAALLLDPGFKQVFELAIKSASKFVVEEIDGVVYAGYVALKVGKQSSDYVKAVDSKSQGDIDNAADDLIKLGN